MFFEKAMEAMDRLAALSVSFMAKVVSMLNNETGEDLLALLGDYVDQASQEAALAVSSGSVRFVVKEIFPQENGIMFFIRSGLPAHISAHGFGLDGSVYEPRKGALADALDGRKIVYVENVQTDPRTQYVKDVASKFNVQGLVVVPFIFENIHDLSFLLIIDSIGGNISDEKLAFLERVRKTIISTVDAAYKARWDLVTRLHHEIRNHLVSIGGFANRIKNKKSLAPETLGQYMDIIMDETMKLEMLTTALTESCKVSSPGLTEISVSGLPN
jgi:hypothetical protein